jgi:DNA polymerase-3 subunit alpha
MAQMREQFVRGAQSQSGMDGQEATELFTQIEKFAGYAFNKSHSAAYAVISYQTAYLKTYYPTEFMAALLSYEMRDQDNVVRYISSAKEHGLMVLPPCVNRSGRDFCVERDADNRTQAIRFGLGAVRGIGDGAIEAILEGRNKGHSATPAGEASATTAFGCLFDFLEQVDVKRVNRRVVEALIKSGACDSFGRPRAQLFGAVERALEGGARAWRDRSLGQANLFAALDAGPGGRAMSQQAYPEVNEWPDKERLVWEKEALGFYITGHPLDHYLSDLPRLTTASTATLAGLARGGQRFGQEVVLGGVVSALRPLKSGQGRMAFVTLEDLFGSCEVLVFSQVFAAGETALKSQEPVLITGQAMIEGDDDEQREVKLRATHIALLGDERMRRAKTLSLSLPLGDVNTALLQALREAFSHHKGQVPVTLTLKAPDHFDAELSCSQSLSVSPSDALMARLENLVGRSAITLN